MLIETCVVGVTSTNCYLLINETTNETVIIDPGDQSDLIISKITELEVEPVGILLTHGHFDHIMATNKIARTYDLKIYSTGPELSLLSDESFNCSNMIRHHYLVEPDVLLEDREIISLAGMDIEVIYTPGHTKGGACYYVEDEGVLFSGDTLFRESIGRTDLPTGDIRALRHSIVSHLFVLPNEVKVYPGHGFPTSIGHEKANNPFVLEYR